MLGASRLAYLGFQPTTGPTGRTAVTLTPNGNLQVDTAQSKFGGASALFDGSGDYLSFDANVLNDMPGNDYTMEMWARFNDTGTFRTLLANQGTNGAVFLQRDNSNKISLFYIGDSATLSTTSTVTSGVWYHIALVVDSGTQKLFLNGTLEASRTETTYTSTTSQGMLGRRQSVTSRDMNGHIDEFRLSNIARYTASFTVPTEPFVNDANTLLLAHMDGTDGTSVFSDDVGTGRSAVGMSAIGNVQIDTAQSYFGGASGLFDGTTDDYIEVPSSTFAIGTGDFTVECWMRTTASDHQGLWHIHTDSDYFPVSTGGLAVAPRVDLNGWVYYANGKTTTTTIDCNINTWYHVALVRNSGTTTLYIDGSSASSKADTVNYSGQYLNLGAYYSNLYTFTGHIDEFRISDTARYTASFTVPTNAFVNDSNTLLLAHMDGTDGSTTFIDDNGT